MKTATNTMVMTELDKVQSILFYMAKRIYVQSRFNKKIAEEFIIKQFENRSDSKSIEVKYAILDYLEEI